MNILGVMLEANPLSFCAFKIDDELYRFSYNRKAGYAYIDRMEDHFIIKLENEKAESVYCYLKSQGLTNEQ